MRSDWLFVCSFCGNICVCRAPYTHVDIWKIMDINRTLINGARSAWGMLCQKRGPETNDQLFKKKFLADDSIAFF